MVRRELLSCSIWLLLSVIAGAASSRLGVGVLRNPGPGFFPFWASVLLASFACLRCLAVLLRTGRDEQPAEGRGWRWNRTILVMASLAAYCLVLPKTGYLVATFALMLLLFLLGRMRAGTALLGAFLAALLSYGLFRYLLLMPLPRGILSF